MKPLELLTEKDKEIIWKWCASYGGAEPESVDVILKEWDKSKRKLLKALGGQLRVRVPIKADMDMAFYYKKLETVYKHLGGSNKLRLQECYTIFKQSGDSNHPFMNALYEFCLNNEKIKDTDISFIQNYTNYASVRDGKTYSANHTFTDGNRKELVIPKGTKTMRAIRRVLEYYDFPQMELFERWRDDISVVGSDKHINTTLVISIHPLDFMTLSDNNSNWTSCFNWRNCGGYSGGTIEMMNSNMAAIAYIENTREDFIFDGDEIPNKMWRTLVFIHRDIIVVGKHYPFQSEVIAKKILDNLQEILYNNLKWKYQYKNQLYNDLLNYDGNTYVRNNLIRFRKYGSFNHHQIFLYSGFSLYNDLVEDNSSYYWCCRNYVKKNLYLNVSGKLTCICCGKPMHSYSPVGERYEDSSSKKICDDCYDNRTCAYCNITKKENETNMITIKVLTLQNYGLGRGWSLTTSCKNCIKNDFWYDKNLELVVKKSSLKELRNNRGVVYISSKPVEEVDKILKSYWALYYTETYDNFFRNISEKELSNFEKYCNDNGISFTRLYIPTTMIGSEKDKYKINTYYPRYRDYWNGIVVYNLESQDTEFENYMKKYSKLSLEPITDELIQKLMGEKL